jgi:hypothetical protein
VAKGSDDAILYLGFENGDIIRMNMLDNSQKVISTGLNARIYDIVEEGEDTLFVGARDRGLVRLVREQDRIIKKSYHIPLNQSGPTNYAPYDLCKDSRGNLHLATTSGAFSLQGDTLKQLYPVNLLSNREFMVNQVAVYKDSLLYAGTKDSGIVVIDIQKDVILKKIPNTTETYGFFQDSTWLYACMETGCKKIRLSNANLNDYGHTPDLFGYMIFDVGETTTQWTLTSEKLLYKEKSGLASLEFSNLRRSYKNLFVKTSDFIILGSGNTLYRFGIHQNPKSKKDHVIATAISENSVLWFITKDYQLYKYNTNENKSEHITKIDIEKQTVPIKLVASSKNLWMISENQLYQINPKNGKIRTFNFKSSVWKTDLKTLYYSENKNRLYIGARKQLFYIANPDNTGNINTIGMEEDKSDIYVTNIYETENNRLFVATLNRGLFECKQDSLEFLQNSGYSTLGNIKEIIYSENFKNANPNMESEFLTLLTSTGFYKYKTGEHSVSKITYTDPDSMQLLGCFTKIEFDKKNAKSGGFMAYYTGFGEDAHPNDNIVRCIQRTGLDIFCNLAAISCNGNNLFIGIEAGLYKYDGKSIIAIPIEDAFYKKTKFVAICVLIAIFLLVLIICYAWNMHKNLNRLDENINEYGQGYRNRMATIRKEDRERKHDKKGISIMELALQIHEDWRKLNAVKHIFGGQKKLYWIGLHKLNRYLNLKKDAEELDKYIKEHNISTETTIADAIGNINKRMEVFNAYPDFFAENNDCNNLKIAIENFIEHYNAKGSICIINYDISITDCKEKNQYCDTIGKELHKWQANKQLPSMKFNPENLPPYEIDEETKFLIDKLNQLYTTLKGTNRFDRTMVENIKKEIKNICDELLNKIKVVLDDYMDKDRSFKTCNKNILICCLINHIKPAGIHNLISYHVAKEKQKSTQKIGQYRYYLEHSFFPRVFYKEKQYTEHAQNPILRKIYENLRK